MGKWNYRRTWRPKNYYRNQRIPSPPTYYDTEFKFRGAWKNIDLPWEERFCLSVGIPWEKVVNAKDDIHFCDIVSKWNDSAAESAFLEAKKRFWAQINDIPTDLLQPDPDMYNQNNIDWNPEIDLQLVKELDLAYFNPDEAGKLETYNATKRNDSLIPGCVIGLNDISKNDDQDWLNKSKNKNIADPWEREITHDDKEIKDAWDNGANKAWNKNATWGNDSRNAGDNEPTWGIGATNSWHYNQFRVQGVDRSRWQNNTTTSRQAQNRQRGNYRDFNCRKREGAQEYTSYKSARLQSDDYRRNDQYWR